MILHVSSIMLKSVQITLRVQKKGSVQCSRSRKPSARRSHLATRQEEKAVQAEYEDRKQKRRSHAPGRMKSRLQQNEVLFGCKSQSSVAGLAGQSCLQRALSSCAQSQGRAPEFHTAIQSSRRVGEKEDSAPKTQMLSNHVKACCFLPSHFNL